MMFLSAIQNNRDDNFRAPSTVDLTSFHWDSWSKTTPDEDVFVITDPTESAFSKLQAIQPGAKSKFTVARSLLGCMCL